MKYGRYKGISSLLSRCTDFGRAALTGGSPAAAQPLQLCARLAAAASPAVERGL